MKVLRCLVVPQNVNFRICKVCYNIKRNKTFLKNKWSTNFYMNNPEKKDSTDLISFSWLQYRNHKLTSNTITAVTYLIEIIIKVFTTGNIVHAPVRNKSGT